MTTLTSPLKRKLFSHAPTDLIHFTPYPNRFVTSARRNGYRLNAAVVRKGVVDPNYNCQDEGWDAAVAQGAPLWQKDLKFAYILFAHYHSSSWLFSAEDTAMIWEIPKGSIVPPELQIVEHEKPESPGAYILQPRKPMSLHVADLEMVLAALNHAIRIYQARHSYVPEPGARVIRFQDWFGPDNPLLKAFPGLDVGYFPEEKESSVEQTPNP
ncbi:MAG: hypothetical protein Q9199_006874 [Rusavskia elegans]